MHPSILTAIPISAQVLLAAVPENVSTFEPLGWLTPQVNLSYARGISPDGTVIVGYSVLAGDSQALPFRWTRQTGMVSLGLPADASDAYATAVNADGSVVVGECTLSNVMNGREAWRWSSASGFVRLGDFEGGNIGSGAVGVSDDGATVIGTGNKNATAAGFIWTSHTGLVELPAIPGGSGWTRAHAISPDGLLVAGSSGSAAVGPGAPSFALEAAVWFNGADPFGLGGLESGGNWSAANAITPGGQVVVGTVVASSSSRPCLWSQDQGLVVLATNGGAALDVSDDGAVVVGYTRPTNQGDIAFIWTAEKGRRPLTTALTQDYGIDMTGWSIQRATGISADGQVIVGYGSLASQGGLQAVRIVATRPGVCCFGEVCVDDVTEQDCNSSGGLFLGFGFQCATVDCTSVGACCFACASAPAEPCPNASGIAASCVVMAQPECEALSGVFGGAGSSCASACGCRGDLNGDGATNAADFSVMAGQFGAGVPDCRARDEGDLNCDGVVDASDFVILAGDFGCSP